MTRNSIDNTRTVLAETIDYLNQLKLPDGKLLSASRRKTFVIGFQTAALSFLGVGDYVFNKFPEARYLLSYRLGQDHIETLFSKIRSKGGFNNNPDVVSFKSALRAVLVKSDITPSPNANCVELLGDDNTSTCSLLLAPKRRIVQAEEEVDEFELDESHQLDVDLCKPILDIVEYIGEYVLPIV